MVRWRRPPEQTLWTSDNAHRILLATRRCSEHLSPVQTEAHDLVAVDMVLSHKCGDLLLRGGSAKWRRGNHGAVADP